MTRPLLEFDRKTRADRVEEIRAIEAALPRIAHGTYGRCIECGEVIVRERLSVLPAAGRMERSR